MLIGFIEPHLQRYGGIRRIVEFCNRLTSRGHQVTIYVPQGEAVDCSWMPIHFQVKSIESGLQDPLDVVLFNHEPQWHIASLFVNARRRVFYALHYGAAYGKEGSWEALRAPVDAILANSTWTAERIAAETGKEATVILGGINPEHFRPVDAIKRYPVLTVGDQRRWKGTDTVRQAAQLHGVRIETYAQKNLPQSAMAAEYAAAEVFAVGSVAEGFGQPGLEALACGTPLVTTDNGGCREYAIDNETALVVPPGDPRAMEAAFTRLRTDAALRQRLTANGLKLVKDKFDWEANTDRFAAVLGRILESPPGSRPMKLRKPEPQPTLSVVVLAWDQLVHTQRCVETLRRHTDVPYELILVDNGSAAMARHYAASAADVSVLNGQNLGFAGGMNSGLRAARGKYIAFCNNDTQFPTDWASRLIETHRHLARPGITAPAVTEAKNLRSLRSSPSDEVEVLDPFEQPVSAVVYLMERSTIQDLGGWGEEFPIASGEDLDLCFKAWVNDLDIALDKRVLVKHVGKATASTKLVDWRSRWERNGQIFLGKWTASHIDAPRIPSCEQERHERNIATARAAASWMELYYETRRRTVASRVARIARASWLIRAESIARPRTRAASKAVLRCMDRQLPRLSCKVREVMFNLGIGAS
jgi:glycosyltransferase involved in cell wall biosynthesis/GT2 family glycosyltransferase